MKWTKQQKEILLRCKTDKELHKHFPLHKIDVLRRYQRRFKNNIPKGRLRKAILLPDIHHPHHDIAAWNAVLKFLKWFQPDIVVLLGDAMEMRAIDHWKREKGDLKSFEGIRLLYDYGLFEDEIMKPIEELLPNAEKVYMGGNHEDWINKVINQNPQLEGMIELEKVLQLKERGWKWIPWVSKDRATNTVRGVYKIGKLTIFHGHYTNIYHARKTADSYSKSTAYGHTHDIQSYTKVHVDDVGDYHTSQSIGCLCNKSPEFMRGRPNRWVHGFGVMYVRPSGHFNLYVPIIINGVFNFADKVFDGNK